MPAQTASNFSQNYLLPIHFTVVKNDQGQTPWCNEAIQRELDAVNSIYPSSIQFYTCEITEITADAYFNFTISGTNLSGLFSLSNNNNAINIYLLNSINGSSVCGFSPILGGIPGVNQTLPLFNSLIVACADEGTMAHEIGHYFGLLHTHQSFGSTFDPSNQQQLVNPPDCSAVGDLICDTPTDPGEFICFGCQPHCRKVFFGGDGDDNHQKDVTNTKYEPSRSNVMSYHCRNCGNLQFSPNQITRITNALEATSGSNRNYLIDANEPTCTSPEFSIFNVNGRLERPWLNNLTPMGGALVAAYTTTPTTSFYAQRTEQHTGRYLFTASEFCKLSTPGVGWRLTPDKNTTAPTQGVTTFDLVKLQQHTLNVLPLDNQPFSLIGADVNNNGFVTTFDIVEIRKLILGIYNKFPNVGAWRFIPRYYLDSDATFSSGFYDGWPFDAAYLNRSYNGTNSWLDNFFPPEYSQFDHTNETNWSFYAIKTGDVTGNANPSGFTSSNPTDINLSFNPHNCLQAGQYAEILLKNPDATPLSSYQMALSMRPDFMQFLGVKSGDLPYFSGANFNVDASNGLIKTLWFDESGSLDGLGSQGSTIFKIQVKANQQVCDISQVFGLEENFIKEYSGNQRVQPSANLEIQVVPITKKHSLVNVYPNPLVGNSINFEINLGEAEYVSVILQDYTGNTASQAGSFLAGSNLVQVSNITNLAGNQFSYQITAGSETFSGTIVKPN